MRLASAKLKCDYKISGIWSKGVKIEDRCAVKLKIKGILDSYASEVFFHDSNISIWFRILDLFLRVY